MSALERVRTTPTVVNPKRSEHERVTQQIINQHSDILKAIRTDWKKITNRHGDIIAIVPEWHISFKDGTDFIMELEDASKKSAAAISRGQ